MRILIISFFVFTFALVTMSGDIHAKDTDVLITVKSKDAKFIGTAAGGARIIIRNRDTGEVVADGITYGGTGDTDLIMADTVARDQTLVTEGSAKFQLTLDFWEPLPVTISASAPLGQPQSMVSVSQDMLLLPGKDYTSGNGIMLEIPGFSVDVTSPQPNSEFNHSPDVPVSLEANVMKLCGCKIAEDTPWNPERYLVEAHIYRDSFYIATFEMPYAGESGIYAQNIKIPLAGTYRLMVTAFDSVTKESGMDLTTVILNKTANDEDNAQTDETTAQDTE